MQLGLIIDAPNDRTPLSPATAPQVGDRVGPYLLVQQIGQGGCGVVYLAEQEFPVRRRVALKVIKLGMDTQSVIVRFEAERQALALMDHPNIAKVFDAGTTETGRPYFVMELVEGVKITDYCDQHNLSTRERLDLFIQVCRAIQHAHQKGIIHRDIKPSNTLVALHDGIPVPKVIDFGIAKAMHGKLTDETFLTAFEQFLGTPAYMSPEQAELNAQDIDTRTDIYSLGVLLYELLTGGTPFDAKDLMQAGLEEIRRTIREQEPPSPSARLNTLEGEDSINVAQHRRAEMPKLVSLVRGDLDWIVMKTLEKDRARRYESASGLAADLQRHLNNEPVVARPPSARYRIQKLVRRHRLVVTAVGLVLAAILTGLGFATWFYFQERQSRRRAQAAEHEISEELWQSQLTQARAQRAGHDAGRRSASLDLLNRAARYRPSLELRNEAIATLALIDLRLAERKTNNIRTGWSAAQADHTFTRVATADIYGNVRLLDGHDGHELMSLPGFGLGVSKVVFSPDDRLLAVYYYPKRLSGVEPQFRMQPFQIWNLASQQVMKLQSAETNCLSLYFSADSTILAINKFDSNLISDETPVSLFLYDLKSGRQINYFLSSTMGVSALDPSGQRLAISSNQNATVLVRDVATGRKIWSLPHDASLNGLKWGDSGNFLATACFDGNIYLWDMKSGNRIGKLPCIVEWPDIDASPGIRFNHSGNLVASAVGRDRRLRLWNTTTGMEICNWPLETSQYPVGISWGDRWLNIDYNRQQTRFEIAGIDETDVLKFIPTEREAIGAVAYSHEGRVLASMHQDGLRFWDAQTGAQVGFQAEFRNGLRFDQGGVHSVAFDRLGKSLFAGSQFELWQWPIQWSIEHGTDKLTLGPSECISPHSHYLPWMNERSSSPTFDHKSTTAVLTSLGEVRLFDLANRTEKNVLSLSPSFRFNNAAVSDNGLWCVITSYEDAQASVFELSNPTPVKRLPVATESKTRALALSPGSGFLLTGDNPTPVKRLPVATESKTVAFSPDSRWLVTGDYERYQFWDTTNWNRRFLVDRSASVGHIGRVAFSADSRIAAVTSTADLVKLVDLASGNELATLESSAPQEIIALEFSPDGSQLTVTGLGQTHYLQLWNLTSLRQKLKAMNLDW